MNYDEEDRHFTKTSATRKNRGQKDRGRTVRTTQTWKNINKEQCRICAKSFTGRPRRPNGVDDPAFSPSHLVVIISNHNVGVLTVHKMNYSSFPLHWSPSGTDSLSASCSLYLISHDRERQRKETPEYFKCYILNNFIV